MKKSQANVYSMLAEFKLIYQWLPGDRIGKRKDGLQKSTRKFLRMTEIFATYVVQWLLACMHMLKIAKFYTLNICSLVYFKYTSIKLPKKKKKNGMSWACQAFFNTQGEILLEAL